MTKNQCFAAHTSNMNDDDDVSFDDDGSASEESDAGSSSNSSQEDTASSASDESNEDGTNSSSSSEESAGSSTNRSSKSEESSSKGEESSESSLNGSACSDLQDGSDQQEEMIDENVHVEDAIDSENNEKVHVEDTIDSESSSRGEESSSSRSSVCSDRKDDADPQEEVIDENAHVEDTTDSENDEKVHGVEDTIDRENDENVHDEYTFDSETDEQVLVQDTIDNETDEIVVDLLSRPPESHAFEHSPGPFAGRAKKKSPSKPMSFVDVSVNFDAPPSNITHTQPVPTIPPMLSDEGTAEEGPAEQEPAPAPAPTDDNHSAQMIKVLHPSEVVKPSVSQAPEQDESRSFAWRIIGICCLGIGVLLMLAALVLIAMNKPEAPPDPRLEHYENAMSIRDSAEIVLQELMQAAEAAAETISARSLGSKFPLLDDFELLASMTLAKATILAPLVDLDKRVEWQTFAKEKTKWVGTSRAMVQATERIQRRRSLQNGSAVLPADSVTVDDNAIGGGTDPVTDSVTIADSGTTTAADNVNDSVTINDDTTAGDDEFGSGTFNFLDPTLPDVFLPDQTDDEPLIRVPFAIHASPRGDPLGGDDDAREYMPVWQLSPVPMEDLSIVNFDLLRQPLVRRLYQESKTNKRAAMSHPFGNSRVLLDDAFVFDGAVTNETTTSPLFAILHPVFNRISEPNRNDGFLLNIYSWDDLHLRSPFPVKLVVENNCGSSSYAFDVTSNGAQYVGTNTWQPDETFVATDFAVLSNDTSMCEYLLSFQYESKPETDSNSDPMTVLFLTALALVLVSIGTVLIVHAMSQQSHQYDILVDQGIQHQGDKLEQFSSYRPTRRSFWSGKRDGEKMKMKDDNVEDECTNIDTADATVVYAMLDGTKIGTSCKYVLTNSLHTQGFCEWSAACDACDAFSLLDNLNNTFDRLVKEHKLSKVDTVGSSFMAVCGVRRRRDDHVIAAANFLREFFQTSASLSAFVQDSTLEELGISLKAGIHCGEVEANYRKSGFQISGATVKEVQRMVAETGASTIHVSPKAYERLVDSDLAAHLVTSENEEDGLVQHRFRFVTG